MIVIAYGSFAPSTDWRDGLLPVDQPVEVRSLGDGGLGRARWSIEAEEWTVRDAAHRLMCSGLLTHVSVFASRGEQVEPNWLLMIGHVQVEIAPGRWVSGIAAGSCVDTTAGVRRIRVAVPGAAPVLALPGCVQPVAPERF